MKRPAARSITGYGCGGYVFPAQAANNYPQTIYTTGYVPLGARFRLSAAWYAANYSGFSTTNQAILYALRHYGAVLADWGEVFAIEGCNDYRWDYADVANLRAIPITAFEMIDTVKPQTVLTGPASLTAGTPASITLTYTLDAKNAVYDFYYYLSYSLNGGSPVNFGAGTVQAGAPAVSQSFTPPSAGSYSITAESPGANWLLPVPLVLTTTGYVPHSGGACLAAGI
jgi:hypothetical protein